MVEKVVLLELNDNYALAMKEGGEVIRIRRKGTMDIGDEIYILPEDLYQEEGQTGGIYAVGAADKREKRTNHWRRLTAIAAMLALVLALVAPQLSMDAYAVVSIDAQQSVQLTVDESNTVLDAASPNGTIPESVLRQLRGKSLTELTPELRELLGGGPFLIAYAPEKDTVNEQAEAEIRGLFANETSVYFSCNRQDVQSAQAQSQTLPRYMLSLLINEESMDLLEDYYDRQDTPDTPDEDDAERTYAQMTLTAMLDALKQNPSLMQSEAFREVLFDKLEEEQDRMEEQQEALSEPADKDAQDDDKGPDADEDASDEVDEDDADESEADEDEASDHEEDSDND